MASDMSFSGFSGIDTAGMVEALMAVESKRLSRVQAQRTTLVSQQTAWNTVSSSLSSLSAAASSVSSSSRLLTTAVSSSNPEAVTAKGSAPVGSVSFAVDRLATSSMHSISGLSSPSATVGAGTLTLSQGLTKIGISRVEAPAAGAFTVAVVDPGSGPTAEASFSGSLTIPVSRSLTITHTSPTDSTARTVSIAAGTYTHEQIASTINAQLSGSSFSVSAASGVATFAVAGVRGSDHSLSFSGTAAASLGLTGSASGTDALVDVDGVRTSVTSVVPGSSFQAGTGSGLATLHIGPGGLSLGTGSALGLAFSSASTVSDVAAAVNSASGSPAVAGVLGGTGTTQILLTSKNSGLDNDLGVSWTGFNAGTASSLRSGSDAQISMGSQVLTRSSNVVTDLVPGATLTLLATTNGQDVTVSGAVDTSSMVTKISAFVTAVNDTLSTLDTLMRATPGNPGSNGALAGDSTARALRRSIVSTMSQAVGTGDYSSLPAVGVTMGRDGKFSVNQSALTNAIAADPQAVTRLFSQATTSTQAQTTFLAAPPAVAAGTYGVSVTRAAERAVLSSNAFALTTSPEILTVSSGSSSVEIAIGAGLTPNQVVASVNEKLAGAKLALFAEVSPDSRLRLVSDAYGSSATVSVTSSGTALGLASVAASGVNVAGTIDGSTAAGAGRTLTGASASTTGLAVSVALQPTDLNGGPVSFDLTYSPGISGLVRSALDAARASGGALDTALTSAAGALQRTDAELARVGRMLEMTENRLRKQFSALESALARIKSSVPNFAALPTGGSD